MESLEDAAAAAQKEETLAQCPMNCSRHQHIRILHGGNAVEERQNCVKSRIRAELCLFPDPT